MKLDDLSKNIYVLNLKKRKDRLEHIKNELHKIECNNYHIFESVDGSTIENKTRLKSGMFGLIKTYLNLHKELCKKNYEDVLIIEDDCVFCENFNSLLETYISNVPKNWDFLYFGANHNYHIGNVTDKINDKVIKLNNSYSAHCVLLKKKVFDDLIFNIMSFSTENDVMMANLQKKYNAYSSTVTLTTQLPNFSNIENKDSDYRWLIK